MEVRVGMHYRILEIHEGDEYRHSSKDLIGSIVYCKSTNPCSLSGGWTTGDFLSIDGRRMYFYGVKLRRVQRVTRTYTLVSMEKQDRVGSTCAGCMFEEQRDDCHTLHKVFGYSCADGGIVKLEDQFEQEEWDDC